MIWPEEAELTCNSLSLAEIERFDNLKFGDDEAIEDI